MSFDKPDCHNTTDQVLNNVYDSSKKILRTLDSGLTSGVNKILTIAAGAIVELKVGGAVLANRTTVEFEALDTGIKWGLSNTVGNQTFDCFKSQFFTRPYGPLITVFFLNTKGTSVNISISELE